MLFGVSILVLLEVALRHAIHHKKRKMFLSFNPCFIGSCSATSEDVWMELSRSKFQSLFYWKLLCDDTSDGDVFEEFKFQSLFYWKLLCDHQ